MLYLQQNSTSVRKEKSTTSTPLPPPNRISLVEKAIYEQILKNEPPGSIVKWITAKIQYLDGNIKLTFEEHHTLTPQERRLIKKQIKEQFKLYQGGTCCF